MSARTASPREPGAALPPVQRLASVLWPSFLLASVGTVGLFTAFDPQEVGECLGRPMDRLGAYTVGFFLLWGLTAASSALTCYFRHPSPPPHGGR